MPSTTLKTVIVSITLLLALAFVLVYKACSRAITIAERFRSENITLTFRSSLAEVTSTHGDILELATCESDEFFRREDQRSLGWFNLGTTVAQITAKCTFRYHLRLSDQWKLDVRSNMCVVRAPSFRPS